jgi:hypothetical protein
VSESGPKCAARFSFGATHILLYVNEITKNDEGAEMVLFTDDANLLIMRTIKFDLKHK